MGRPIILGLKREYSDKPHGGWEWDELDYWGEKYSSFKTNKHREGLWEHRHGAGWVQILGTTQFSLPVSPKAAHAKLMRIWKKEAKEYAPTTGYHDR